MSKMTDQQYLLNEEYRDASNLHARLHFFERFSTNTLDQYRWIFDHFRQEGSRQRVLELGCGPGSLWQKNLDRIPADWTITLSDFSPGMLQDAQRTLGNRSRSFSYQIIDAQAIPFEASHFDIVIANNMLYHVPDRQRALSEIHRILKPEGHFYTSTIGETSLSEINRLMKQYSIAPWAKTLGFSLENGAEQLAAWFAHVDLDRLENVLMVTEAEPLLQMISSGIAPSNSDEGKILYMRKEIEQQLLEHGAIRLALQVGLFVADGKK